MRDGLQTAQEELAKLSERAFTRHHEIVVRLPAEVRKTASGYPDAVDLLFDLYQKVSDEIQEKLGNLRKGR